MNSAIILNFLAELSNNNNKSWFDANRQQYELAKKEFEKIIDNFIEKFSEIDNSLQNITAKQCIFRINKDIRFSKDKIPYKNWFGAYIVEGGRKNWMAGYYIQFQPNNSFIAAGLYQPIAIWLLKVRQKISEEGDKLLKLIDNEKFKIIWGNFVGDTLKKTPRDFKSNDKFIDLIRFKSYELVHYVKDKDILDIDNFLQIAIENFKIAKPVCDFFNEAIK